MERCINQQPTNITFSWKDHLKFEDHYMKVPVTKRVYADFECINQPQNTAKLASHAGGALHTEVTLCNPKVLFEQIPIAVGYYLISLPGSLCVTPSGNKCYSYFGTDCVKRFVNEMLTLQHEANEYFKTNKLLEMSPEEEDFEQSTICWLCENPLGDTQSASGDSGEKLETMIT